MLQGDLVVRKSYGADVLFKINALSPQVATLKGVEFRLLADAPLADLMAVKQPSMRDKYEHQLDQRTEMTRRGVTEYQQEHVAKSPSYAKTYYFELPGKVLHLDGDQGYLRKSMELYRELRIPAVGHFVAEHQMAQLLYKLLPTVRPDIVVLTGHDGILKNRRTDPKNLDSYKNSHHFVNAVRLARQYERNRDALTIIAGACQSHFEALLSAGANFASSPARILIHALDPLQIAAKASYTSIRETIDVLDVLRHTVSGVEGLGGIESRGSYRLGLPKFG